MSDDLFDSGKNIRETIGHIINENAFKLGVFKNLDQGMRSNEA